MLNCKHPNSDLDAQTNIDNGVDGEKYRRRSVTESGRQWDARTGICVKEHSGAAIRKRVIVSKGDEL
jgi:hypothetical protein